MQTEGILCKLLSKACAHNEELLGEVKSALPSLKMHDDNNFWARIERHPDELIIRVGGGLAFMVQDFWERAYADRGFTSGFEVLPSIKIDDAVDVSVVWLFLHEMQHYDLGHFDILQTASIAEAHPPTMFGLVERSKPRTNWFDDLAPNEVSKLEPCLEMQADHEAIELLLDAYSADEWPSLRARIASISAMVVLIEREDAKRTQAHSSHPKAATRIFQLLGHVVDMPTIPATLKMRAAGAEKVNPNDLPTDTEQQAFMREVIIPSFFDAVNLARVAGADSIGADLGNADEFFRDIQIAKLGDLNAFADLKTVGAQEWANLMFFNETLKSVLSTSLNGRAC